MKPISLLLLSLVPAGLANPVALFERAACNADNCARAITPLSGIKPSLTVRQSDCSSFMRPTITGPAVTTTVTSSLTNTFTTTTTNTISSTTVTSVTSTQTANVISTTTTLVVDSTTTTETTTVKSAIGGGNAKRQASTVTVPTYASACSGTVRYSSACSCMGITASTSTITPTVTVTATATASTTSTVKVVTTTIQTSTDSTITTTSTSTTTTSTSITVSTATATATVNALDCATTSFPVVHPEYTVYYNRQYRGAYVTENYDNIGNPAPDDYPPIVTSFPSTVSVCDVIQQCVVLAHAANDNYLSVDVHYVQSSDTWVCVQFYDPSPASSFNVADPDVLAAYGYSYQY